jgi:demethylmenaquinone methyltransferase/2-methoxy-6-polyprenyl-1,4-benzoquinol methylase
MPGDDGIQERKLNDGRTFRIVKLYYDPAELSERLRNLGWRVTCSTTSRYFLYGEGTLT